MKAESEGSGRKTRSGASATLASTCHEASLGFSTGKTQVIITSLPASEGGSKDIFVMIVKK